jgi:hypothetical protein
MSHSDYKIENLKKITYNYTDEDAPFIFICTSLGVGKTQLPFCLDIPIFYIIFNEEIVKMNSTKDINAQKIYLPFIEISKVFLDCLKKDYEIVMRLEDNKKFEFNKTSQINMPEDDQRLFINVFIIYLYQEMSNMRNINGNTESWIISQLRIKLFCISPISSREARLKIKNINESIRKKTRMTTIMKTFCRPFSLMNV